MKLMLKCVIITFFGCLLNPLFVFANEATIAASGNGLSKAEAMRDMKRNAVEQALGSLVKSSTVVENFEVKHDKILTMSEGFVKKVSDLEETHHADSGWSVKAVLTLSTESIKNEMMALKMLQIDAEMPRVAVITEEYLNGENKGLKLTETNIIKLLRAKQFNLIDPEQVKLIRSNSIDRALIEGNNKWIQLIKTQLNADFVVIAKTRCTSSLIMEGVMMKTHQVTSSVKVMNAGTGALIAADTTTGKAAHISEQVGCEQAIGSAISSLFNEHLTDQMIHTLSDNLNNGMKIHLAINKGLDSY
ncbi:MAG: hypothetical protein Q9M31_03740, partial [Mariprofundus sp.]|nr:hypothetical protein [Mariprofundus sp.]